MKVKNPVDENDKTMGEFEWEEFLKKNDVMVDKYSSCGCLFFEQRKKTKHYFSI